jgi:hypothetical protein
VLYGVFIASVGAFNGDVTRDIAAHTLELAEKQSDCALRSRRASFTGGQIW